MASPFAAVATQAKLSNPTHAVQDSAGNICIADKSNCRVRKVNTAGVITTFAGLPEGSSLPCGRTGDGGPAIAGSGIFWFNGDGLAPLSTDLNSPTPVVKDAAGNLYIAEKSSCRIRKLDAANNVMVTIGGTGSCGSNGDGGQATQAKINGPENLALDPSGILYLTESFTPRVRQIDLETGIITRTAGTGVSGYSGDGGDAVTAQLMRPGGLMLDPTGPFLYIADHDAGNVPRVTLDGGGGSPPIVPATIEPVVTWLLVILGWLVTIRAQRRAENRRDLKAQISELAQMVRDVESAAHAHLQTAGGSEDAKRIALRLKVDLGRLRQHLARLRPRGRRALSDAVDALQAAVTKGDFECAGRQPTDLSSARALEVSMAAGALLEMLESAKRGFVWRRR